AEDGIRDFHVTGVQTCALPISVGLDLDARTGGRQVLAVGAQGLAGEIFQDATGADGLAYALGQGLALLTRQQAADLFATLHDQEIGRASCREREEKWTGDVAGE